MESAIKYSAHLEFRLKVREISYDLPLKIFREAKEHYYDTATKHCVAVGQVKFEGKLREMALSYERKGRLIVLITIHPIGPNQKNSRIISGRWKRL
jgi:hypothetical protein